MVQKVMNSKIPPTVAATTGTVIALVLPGVQAETRAIIAGAVIAAYKLAEGIRERGSKSELSYLVHRYEELTGEK